MREFYTQFVREQEIDMKKKNIFINPSLYMYMSQFLPIVHSWVYKSFIPK